MPETVVSCGRDGSDDGAGFAADGFDGADGGDVGFAAGCCGRALCPPHEKAKHARNKMQQVRILLKFKPVTPRFPFTVPLRRLFLNRIDYCRYASLLSSAAADATTKMRQQGCVTRRLQYER